MSGRAKLLLAFVAVVVGGVVAVSMLRGGGSDLVLVAPAAERAAIDAGEPGPSLGDMTVFGGPLLDDDGEPAGRIDGSCVITSQPGSEDECYSDARGDATFEVSGDSTRISVDLDE